MKDRKRRKTLREIQRLQIVLRGEKAERDCLKGIVDRATSAISGAFIESLMQYEGRIARLTGEIELLNKEIEEAE